jgi:glycosyltransferase involved in cell wall biosynthesis
VTALHQLLPVLDPGDAVSGHTLQLQATLRSMGVKSEIFCERTHPDLASAARPYADYPGGPALYHVAIGSRMADWALHQPGPLLLDHHNLTPARFFEAWDPALVHGTAWGRAQLLELCRRTVLGLADSRYNETDLLEAGCAAPTAVVPILFDSTVFDRPPDPLTTGELEARKLQGGADWLFVGRVVPNKCQHQLIAAFAWYRRVFDPRARLWLVGGASSHVYERALRAFVDALGLSGSVTFTGPVSHGALTAHFRSADVYVCLSDHEGFCVPLLEALHHEVPVVAFAATAVPETLGHAGLLLTDKSPAVVATAVDRILADQPLRRSLMEHGRTRLAELSLARARERFIEAVTPVLEQL